MTTIPPLDEGDLSAMEFWARENPLGPNGPGYYVLTPHADVVHATGDPAVPCSAFVDGVKRLLATV